MGMQDHFDLIADAELRFLEGKLGELDPDEFPDDMTPALQHLVQHGFSILNVEDSPQA